MHAVANCKEFQLAGKHIIVTRLKNCSREGTGSVILFLWAKHVTKSPIYWQLVVMVFGETIMYRRHDAEWCRKFAAGRESSIWTQLASKRWFRTTEWLRYGISRCNWYVVRKRSLFFTISCSTGKFVTVEFAEICPTNTRRSAWGQVCSVCNGSLRKERELIHHYTSSTKRPCLLSKDKEV